MEIKIDREKLVGKSIMLCTPMYGGNCKGDFMSSVLRLQATCQFFGVELHHMFIYNASLIQRGRNDLADIFLNHEAKPTHLLFIDADIVFEGIDIIAMLAADKELIGGPYPMKDVDWAWARDYILANPDVTEEELQCLAKFYHFNLLHGTKIERYDEVQEVLNVSTGCMMIARAALEKIQKKWPNDRYSARYARDVDRGDIRWVYNFFNVVVEDDTMYSEDYYFCKRWRELGEKVWLVPWMLMRHIGDYTYGGGGLPHTAAAIEAVHNYRAKKL